MQNNTFLSIFHISVCAQFPQSFSLVDAEQHFPLDFPHLCLCPIPAFLLSRVSRVSIPPSGPPFFYLLLRQEERTWRKGSLPPSLSLALSLCSLSLLPLLNTHTFPFSSLEHEDKKREREGERDANSCVHRMLSAGMRIPVFTACCPQECKSLCSLHVLSATGVCSPQPVERNARLANYCRQEWRCCRR